MKKIIACVGLLGLVAIFSGEAEAATPVRLFIGGYAEAAYFYLYQGYGFGGELGIQVSEMLSLVAEGARGTMTQTEKYESDYSKSQYKTELTLTPLCLSIHFTAPISDRLQPYVGVGVAYSSLKMTESSSYQSIGGYDGSISESETRNFHAFAPVFKLGLAVSLIRNVWIVGEYKQIVAAKDQYTYKSAYSTSESDIYFGTADLKLGIRIVI
jgi:opacity protein-like surface antigen